MNSNKRKSDKFIACLLVSVIFLMYLQNVWYPFFHPEEHAQKVAAQTGVQNADQTASQNDTNKVIQQNSTIPPTQANDTVYTNNKINDKLIAEKGIISIETDVLTASISLLGGRLTSLELKNYNETVKKDSPLMNLVDHRDGAPLPLGIYQDTNNDEGVLYTLTEINQQKSDNNIFKLGNTNEIRLTLQGTFPNGEKITKKFTFKRNSYLFNFSYTLANANNQQTKLEWTRFISEENGDAKTNLDGEFVWWTGSKVRRENFSALKAEFKNKKRNEQMDVFKIVPDTEKHKDDKKIKWLAMDELYFNEVIIDNSSTTADLQGEIIIENNQLYRIRLNNSAETTDYNIYAGPKKYDIMAKYGDKLEKNINLGKMGFFPAGLVSLIATPMMLLLNFLFKIFGNYGVAIIGLTIFVKLITFPINMSSLKHMKIMADLQPEVKAIQEKMKETKDPNALMEFYKKKGVNPMGGCLPAFIQIPFFIGLYAALYCAFELRHAPFALWINDLSTQESLMIAGIPIPMLVVLFTLFMLVQQWLTPMAMDPSQKKAMMIMPLFFGFILARLPAGLTLYMLVNSVISVAQQKVFNRTNSVKDTLIANVICSFALICLGIIFTLLK